MTGTAATAGFGAVPAAVSSSSKSQAEVDSHRSPPAIYKVDETDQYDVMVADTNDRASIGKFYTADDKEGRLDLIKLTSDVDIVTSSGQIELVSRPGFAGADTVDSDVSKTEYRRIDPSSVAQSVEITSGWDETVNTNATAGNPGIGIQSAGIVAERSKNISREIGSCSEDFCSNRTYQHRQTGFSVEFNDYVDEIGIAAISETINILAKQYLRAKWAKYLRSGSGAIVGIILGAATGRSYTVSPYDVDINGWIRSGPRVRLGVGSGWDLNAGDLTTVPHNPKNTHIAEFEPYCG